MGVFRKIRGTIASAFFVGAKQNRVDIVPSDSGTAVNFLNKDNTDYVVVRGKDPAGPSDFTTKNWIATNVSGVTTQFEAGENLSPGDLVVINASGLAIKADPIVHNDVDGVNRDAVTTGSPATILMVHGPAYIVRFAVAPAAADNGKRVYLGAPGTASVAPPGGGNFIISLGRMQGADGITTSPQVLFKPQLFAFTP